MKIGFIHQPMGPIWISGTSGSVSIWVYEVARRLARSHEVIVYACRGHSQPKVEHSEGVEYRRVSIAIDNLVLKLLKPLNRFRDVNQPLFLSSVGYLKYVLTAAHDLQKRGCDILHIVGFPNFVPIVRAFHPEIPIVLHMHGDWLTRLNAQSVNRWLNDIDLVLSVSESISKETRRLFPKFAARCHTVLMGVDVNHFCDNRQSITIGKDSTRLLYVGRVSPEKGLHILLEAFATVVRHYPEATLKIVGPEWIMPREFIVELSNDPKISALASFYNGSYLSHLRNRVPSEVTQRLTFVDLVVHEKVNNYFLNADLYINPSFTEGLPMSIIEAMASGLPVVATRVGGVAELVEHGRTGVLVESGDATAMAKAILDLIPNQNLRESMGTVARARAVEMFSWDCITEKLVGLYRDVLDQKGK